MNLHCKGAAYWGVARDAEHWVRLLKRAVLCWRFDGDSGKRWGDRRASVSFAEN